jgi:plastocyanin
MMRRTWLAIAFVGVLGLLAIVGPVSAANRGVRIGEANDKYFFGPQTQYANVGDTVTWTNGSDAPHTVTSDSGTELASDTLAAGATFDHTFAAAGTFTYHCKIHSYMTAKVVVLAAGTALPATDTSLSQDQGDSTVTGSLLIVLLAGLAVGVLAVRRFRPTTES